MAAGRVRRLKAETPTASEAVSNGSGTSSRRPGGRSGAPPRGTEVVALVDVHKAYQQGPERVIALAGVDLSLARGESVALVGRSGSGKSTLGHLVGGLDRPDRGSVSLGGADVASLSASGLAVLRRRTVGFVFQFFHLLPGLSVRENVALPLLLDAQHPDRDRVDRLLDSVGMGPRAEHLPSQLSGGEMQRTAIARALVMDPAVIVADEPTGNLDSVTAAEVLDVLLARVSEQGAGLLLVTHDPKAAQRADRLVTLADGMLS
ncbi:MAG: ABC transporter ATP-binding protein [Acidimicrobiales bacterium]